MFPHLSKLKSLRTLAGAAFLAVSGAAGVLYAVDPLPPAAPVAPAAPPASPAARPEALSDVALARAALAALDADPVLKDVNLVVSVVDRAAVIGGPVNGAEVMRRAEEVVRAVPGIESVKNTCFVQADPDPLLRAVAVRLKPGAKPNGSAALPGVAVPPGAPAGFIPPLPPEQPSDLVAAKPNTVVALHPGLPVGPAVGVLGAPVGPAGTAAPVATPLPAPPAGTLTAVAQSGTLQAGVATIRAADARFARLTVEAKPDGGVLIGGWAATPADVWDFAAALRKLPGVARVAVDPNLVR